jgi:phage-related minor tail protein
MDKIDLRKQELQGQIEDQIKAMDELRAQRAEIKQQLGKIDEQAYVINVKIVELQGRLDELNKL